MKDWEKCDRCGTTGYPAVHRCGTCLHAQTAPATFLPVDDIANLEQRVAAMRRLGVTRWADIELGPQPSSEPDESKVHEQRATLAKQQAERAERLRFAASGGPRLGNGRSR